MASFAPETSRGDDVRDPQLVALKPVAANVFAPSLASFAAISASKSLKAPSRIGFVRAVFAIGSVSRRWPVDWV